MTANHQEKNALVLADQGAAELLQEAECVENTLYDTTALLMREKERREAMIQALKDMAVPDAGQKIYETLVELVK